MTLAEYLRRQNAAIVLLVDIDYDTADPIRLSTLPYITEPGDSDANVLFAPVVAKRGLPRLSQRLRDVWGGLAVASWGDLPLVSHRVNHNGTERNLATESLRGRSLRLRITGPRSLVPYSEARTIFIGRIAEATARSDGSLRLTLEDTSAAWLDAVLPPARYDAAAMPPGFPASNDGKPRPMVVGKVAHARPALIDATNHIYEFDAYAGAGNVTVHSMYDNGAAVAFTDNGDGTVTLVNPPSGVITGTPEVTLTNGTNTNEEWQIAEHLLTTYGGVTTFNHWTSGVTGSAAYAGVYLSERTTLGEVVGRIARGMFGWCAMAPDGSVSLQALDVPAAGGPTITAAQRLGDVEWRDLPTRYNRIPVLYERNDAPRDTVAASVGLDFGAYLQSEGNEGAAEDAADITTRGLLEAPRMTTPYLTPDLAYSNSVSAANRALALLSSDRRRVSFAVAWAAWNWDYGLGDSLTLDGTPVDGDYLITAFERTRVGGIAAIRIEAVG